MGVVLGITYNLGIDLETLDVSFSFHGCSESVADFDHMFDSFRSLYGG